MIGALCCPFVSGCFFHYSLSVKFAAAVHSRGQRVHRLERRFHNRFCLYTLCSLLFHSSCTTWSEERKTNGVSILRELDCADTGAALSRLKMSQEQKEKHRKQQLCG
eukprot:4501676-Amphidinium_carterae.1